ncbi:MAG: M1 family metallopeptidase [Promethearchaeota archaeon]
MIPNISDNISEDSEVNEYEPYGNAKIALNSEEFSYYNLSVIFDGSTSSVTGNLSVNYYNNDSVSFTQIPFHLFLSGMQYKSRMGSIEILNVTTMSEPKLPLTFEVDIQSQLLWVTLESELQPFHRTFFEIKFISIIPDGGIDRANSHGSDIDQSRIYKFTSFYPMPCVYDIYDQWNIDPYLGVGDPFYHDMAYYNLFIRASNEMIITATGELVEKSKQGSKIIYHFDPVYPVREVTFAASKYYQIDSTIINGVNISTYYLPKSSFLWEDNALDSAINAYNLFNSKFGTYPYSTLNIVEEYSNYGGMEYPAQVYASERIDNYGYPLEYLKAILEKVVAHEIAHQWWYNLVGFDEIDWGFLDEGLACWSTDYYATFYHGDWEYFQGTRYYDRVRTYYATNFLPSRINQSAYDLIENNLDWVYISYYKAPLIFEKISRTIGQSNFLLGLHNFLEEYKFRIALLSNLQDILENIVKQNLDWLFFPWFDNDYIPDYKIAKCYVNTDTNTLSITIEDENEDQNRYFYSQQARLYVFDSRSRILFNDYIWINSTTTLVVPLDKKPYKVRLDYADDVIVQLENPSITYIEFIIKEDLIIPGYNLTLTLIALLFPIVLLCYKSSNKRQNKFRT